LVFLVGLGALAGPQLRVDQPVYDFGQVTEGYVVKHTFLITNVGDAPARFTYPPITSCGCTTAPLPKQELAPGESMELPVLFDSSGYGGKEVTETVTLYLEGESPLRLVLQGFVEPAGEHQRPASTLFYSYYILVDVRAPEAFARGHLLGAVNIPLAELPKLMTRLPEGARAVPIFVYDETGQGASQGVGVLVEGGFYFARSLAGGLSGWWQGYGDLFWLGEPPTGLGAPEEGERAVSSGRLARDYLLLLDLRPAEEFAQGHLPGAVNVEPEALPGWLWELPRPEALPPGVKLTVWCLDEDGEVAARVAGSLQAAGLPAYAVVGGLNQWRELYGQDLFWRP